MKKGCVFAVGFVVLIGALAALVVKRAVNGPWGGGSSQFRVKAEPPGAADAVSLALILDTSGSMNDAVAGGASKLDVAKDVLTNDFLPALSDDLYTSLYRFEEKDSLQLLPLRRNSARDAEKWLHREAMMELVDSTSADGSTPIVASLRRARGDLAGVPGRRIVVLVTDGEESYYAKDIVLDEIRNNRDAKIETFVVGFNLGDQGTYIERELGLGRGYFQANGGRDALLAAMTGILAAIEK